MYNIKLSVILFILSFITYSLNAQLNVNQTPKTTGAQYLIITLDDNEFTEKLQQLANFRQEQGISTKVVTTTEIGGSTVISIGNYIKEAYYTWDIQPIAVMLIGDNNKLPSPIYPAGSKTKSDISDNSYADVDGDHLPDLAISRLPINEIEILSNYIDRVINYETNPPLNPGYYLKPITSMGWSNNSDNMICAEAANGFFSNTLEKEPIRQNAIFEGTPGIDWECSDELFLLFGPDGEAYVPATPEYLTNWNGNSEGINNALSNGTFLILNLDNGTELGWSAPEYWTENVYELVSSEPFFVFTINDLNAKFNWSFDSFAEVMTKNPNGSIGIIASTMSLDPLVPAFYFSSLMDGIWEDFLSLEQQSIYPLNFALPAFANVAAKYYIGEIENSIKTIYSFHYFGEPFCPIIYELPQEMEIIHDESIIENVDFFEINAPENSIICLSVNHEILCTAPGTGSDISMPVDGLLNNDTLLVTVTKQNHYRYSKNVVWDEVSTTKKNYKEVEPMLIYPNPAYENLRVELNNPFSENLTLQIQDSKGKIVRSMNIPSENTQSIQVHLSGLRKGMYVILVKSESFNSVRKFIKTE